MILNQICLFWKQQQPQQNKKTFFLFTSLMLIRVVKNCDRLRKIWTTDRPKHTRDKNQIRKLAFVWIVIGTSRNTGRSFYTKFWEAVAVTRLQDCGSGAKMFKMVSNFHIMAVLHKKFSQNVVWTSSNCPHLTNKFSHRQEVLDI